MNIQNVERAAKAARRLLLCGRTPVVRELNNRRHAATFWLLFRLENQPANREHGLP